MSEETLDNIETVAVEDAKPEEVVTPEVVEEPKVEEPKVEDKETENVIDAISTVKNEEPAKVAGLGPVENGAIGSAKVNKTVKPAAKASKPENNDKVAVFSSKNVTWNGVGKVYRGYNIVAKEASEQWLKRDHIRLATPEEVAKEFGL